MYKRYVTPILTSLAALLLSVPMTAAANQTEFAYFTLTPDVTTNFHTSGRQLGYVQIRIDVMVASQSDLKIVETHQPLIRDTVLETLGRQTDATIKSLPGREELRQTLTTQINDTLLPEVGRPIVADLLFTKYLYQ